MNYVKIKRNEQIWFFSYHDFLSGLWTTKGSVGPLLRTSKLILKKLVADKWEVERSIPQTGCESRFKKGQIVTEDEAEWAFEANGASIYETEKG